MSSTPGSGASAKTIRNWILYREPNQLFICRNVTLLLLVVPGFLLGVDVLRRSVDDLKLNAALRHTTTDGASTPPEPCGLATPDPLELLKALDRENGYLDIYQIVFADYETWNSTVHHALCGTNFADWPDGNDNDHI